MAMNCPHLPPEGGAFDANLSRIEGGTQEGGRGKQGTIRSHDRGTIGLVIFFALLISASALLETLIAKAGGIQHSSGLTAATMAVPGISAIIALLVTSRTIRGIGWGLPRPMYLGLAVLLPIVVVVPVYVVISLAGLAPFSAQGLVHVAQLNFGTHVGPLASLALIAGVGLLLDCIVAAGEEIGWRGYLFPQLATRMQPAKAALLTGAIWAVWHYAGILFGGYREESTPLLLNLMAFTVMVLGWALVLGWLRYVSASVWPAVVMHGAHNLLLQALLASVFVQRPAAKYFTGEFGAGVALAYAIAGIWAYRALSSSNATTAAKRTS